MHMSSHKNTPLYRGNMVENDNSLNPPGKGKLFLRIV